jgi:hypothetical protein
MVLSFASWMNLRVRKLDWIDMGCAKAGAMLFALLAAKLCPALLSLPLWVYAVSLVLVSIRPVSRALSRESG